jgi:hypothetical protein
MERREGAVERPAKRSAAADALRAMIVVLVWLGLIEGALRITHVPVTGSHSMRDEKRGFRPRPGAAYWFEAEGWNLSRNTASVSAIASARCKESRERCAWPFSEARLSKRRKCLWKRRSPRWSSGS